MKIEETKSVLLSLRNLITCSSWTRNSERYNSFINAVVLNGMSERWNGFI